MAAAGLIAPTAVFTRPLCARSLSADDWAALRARCSTGEGSNKISDPSKLCNPKVTAVHAGRFGLDRS